MRGILKSAAVAALGSAISVAAPGKLPAAQSPGKAAPAAGWVACGEGVEARLAPGAARQGGIVVLELRAAVPLVSARGRWGQRPLPFWREPDGRFRALLGVDLDHAPGAETIQLWATTASARRTCELAVEVAEGAFRVERLRVEPRFVTPPPEELERIRREAERLRQVFAQVSEERLWRQFVPPVAEAGPRGNFGSRRVLNEEPRAAHAGEDYAAPPGAPVVAAARGRVVLAAELYYAGKTVILDHGLGLFTFYAHLSRISVAEGALVEAGAEIGRVGATGRVTGAHLHWAARLGPARVNPLDLLALPE